MNILCIIPTLGHGGAQRVLVELAEHLASTPDNAVSFLTFKGDEEYFYKLSDHIPVHCIQTVQGNKISWMALLKTPIRIRQKIKSINPDTIISFQDVANFPTILAAIGLKTKLIISERLDPTHHSAARIRKYFRTLLYPLANKIVVQTNAIAALMPRSTSGKIAVIPNAAPVVLSYARPDTPSSTGFHAIAAGRLEQQKNFSFLISAVDHAQPKLKNWHIDIYGEGSQREDLQRQIEARNLQNLVTIHKACIDLGTKMQQSHLYLLSSSYEGFPNVLLEAIACGLPCIASRSVSGVEDMVQNNINGITLPQTENTIEMFGDALVELANNDALRKEMGENSCKIVEQFQRKTIYTRWQHLLNETTDPENRN